MVEAYMLELTRLRRNRLYQAQTEAHLKALGDRVGDRIEMWTAASLQAWICMPGLAPATQRNRNATVRAFLEWAKRMQYIQRSPIEGIHRLRFANHTGKEIESFSVSEICSLLRGLLFESYDAFSPKKGFYKKPFHELIGYVVLAVFCGVRPEEIRKVALGRLDLVGRTLLITKEASKTASTRVIELPRVAVVWLRLWRWKCPHQKLLVPKNFQKKWDSLRAVTLKGRWVHDGMRHTFASMHYAVHRNAAELKALMGHSQNENTLFAHYRAVQTLGGEVVTKKMGLEFWAMTPKRVRLSASG
jgi:integrase